MERYNCVVCPDDSIRAYTSENEVEGENLFVLVAQDNQDKISTILSKDDAFRLYHQLGKYLEGLIK